MSQLGKEIPNPPSDGITALRFAGESTTLLASSWDGSIKIYDAAQGEYRTSLAHGAPVLDANFAGEDTIYAGGLDNSIKRFDVATGQETLIGSHTAAVKCVEWLPGLQLLATAGWDAVLNLWDPRQSSSSSSSASTQAPVASFNLPGKAYTMSQTDSRLVVGTSGRRVDIYNLSTITDPAAVPEQRRESSMKYQTRVLRCYPNGEGYALGSIEGRVAMEYFDLSEPSQSKKYAFKCHRKHENGKDMVYPVNALAFNTKYGTFATGGGDGVVNIWDGANKKRLQQITGYPTSVAALAFSASGGLLAVAASYAYEQGEKEDKPQDAIYIREMVDTEIMPRVKQSAA